MIPLAIQRFPLSHLGLLRNYLPPPPLWTCCHGIFPVNPGLNFGSSSLSRISGLFSRQPITLSFLQWKLELAAKFLELERFCSIFSFSFFLFFFFFLFYFLFFGISSLVIPALNFFWVIPRSTNLVTDYSANNWEKLSDQWCKRCPQTRDSSKGPATLFCSAA